MSLRVFPINSSADAATVPGVNDFDLLRLETNLLTEGVLQAVGSAFAVSQRGAGANLSVDVAAGLALIQITNTNVAHGRTYKTWLESTAVVNKAIAAADLTNPRKDRVVLRINVSTDPDGSAANIAIIEVLTGTPAGSPTAPAEPSNAITLAIVNVAAGTVSIINANIVDSRPFLELSTGELTDVARATDLSDLVDSLASNSHGEGASTVGIEDAGGNFTADNVEDALSELYDALPLSAPWAFGDGSDGNVTMSGDDTLTRDMYYGTLDLGNHTLNTAGYKVFAKTITGSGGKIKAPTGGVGGNAATQTGGGAGTPAASGSHPQAPAGVGGGNGGNGAGGGSNLPGAAGSNGVASANSFINQAGTAGRAGAAGTGGGGGSGGGAGTTGTLTYKGHRSFITLERFASLLLTTWTALTAIAGTGGSGGGGGGNGAGAHGGGGGGSGAGGGFWSVFCETASGTWSIESIGGAGGNAAVGQTGGGQIGGTGGAGRGGPGGSGIFAYKTMSGTVTFTLTGGADGTGNGSSGTAQAGVAVSIQVI